ncbi:MAG: hypothetical protein MHMPM18_003574 [Marteilia pararefringens]
MSSDTPTAADNFTAKKPKLESSTTAATDDHNLLPSANDLKARFEHFKDLGHFDRLCDEIVDRFRASSQFQSNLLYDMENHSSTIRRMISETKPGKAIDANAIFSAIKSNIDASDEVNSWLGLDILRSSIFRQLIINKYSQLLFGDNVTDVDIEQLFDNSLLLIMNKKSEKFSDEDSRNYNPIYIGDNQEYIGNFDNNYPVTEKDHIPDYIDSNYQYSHLYDFKHSTNKFGSRNTGQLYRRSR